MSATGDLLERLQRHYIKPGAPLPGGIFVPEVGMNDGPFPNRRCDAIYVGFTSTSGRLLVGHELKVSRADWRHELDQSGKADAWHDACHEWWVVAPSTEIVYPETLPAGWGLMVPSTRTTTRMDQVVKAARRPVTPPWWAVRSVMARQDTLRAEEIGQARQKARDEIHAEVQRQLAERAKTGAAELTYQQRGDLAVVDAFRVAGIRLVRGSGYGDGCLGLDDLLPLVGLISEYRRVEEMRQVLAERWGGAPAVLKSAKELVKAVDALAPVRAEAAS